MDTTVSYTHLDVYKRQVFNILGPLSNPSRARAMLVGVYSPALTEVIAGTMMNLGVERGMVVSGEDNMDAVSYTHLLPQIRRCF